MTMQIVQSLSIDNLLIYTKQITSINGKNYKLAVTLCLPEILLPISNIEIKCSKILVKYFVAKFAKRMRRFEKLLQASG